MSRGGRELAKKIAGGDPAMNLWHSFMLGTLVLRHGTQTCVDCLFSPCFPPPLNCVLSFESCNLTGE
jgi:hypothetical protein